MPTSSSGKHAFRILNLKKSTAIMFPEFWIWNNKFRVLGVLLALTYHIVLFSSVLIAQDAQVAGYRWLFSWYMPSMLLGFPWSVVAFFAGVFVPGGTILGLALAVCLNGYLVGLPIDLLVNHARRNRQRHRYDLAYHPE